MGLPPDDRCGVGGGAVGRWVFGDLFCGRDGLGMGEMRKRHLREGLEMLKRQGHVDQIAIEHLMRIVEADDYPDEDQRSAFHRQLVASVLEAG